MRLVVLERVTRDVQVLHVPCVHSHAFLARGVVHEEVAGDAACETIDGCLFVCDEVRQLQGLVDISGTYLNVASCFQVARVGGINVVAGQYHGAAIMRLGDGCVVVELVVDYSEAAAGLLELIGFCIADFCATQVDCITR